MPACVAVGGRRSSPAILMHVSVHGLAWAQVARCGPVAMFLRCCDMWRGTLAPAAVASKVKHFFTFYAINRHKTTVSAWGVRMRMASEGRR